MATINKRPSGKWQATVRRDGRSSSKTFSKRADAVIWARETEVRAERNGAITLRMRFAADVAQPKTVREALDTFAREVSCGRRSDSSGDVERIRLRALSRSKLARLRLDVLTTDDVAIWRDARLMEVSASTVRREMTLLRSAIGYSLGPDARNVVALVSRPPSNDRRERRLRPGEWSALLESCDRGRNPLLRPLLVLALETGMRRGELLALEWRYVDLHRCTAFLPRTKTGSPRTVPLSPLASQTLRELPRTDDRVIPLGIDGARHGFERVRARAGVEDLRLHDLRHECISRLVERGLSLPEVQMVSGHRDVSMLLRYTHLQTADIVAKLHESSRHASRLQVMKTQI